MKRSMASREWLFWLPDFPGVAGLLKLKNPLPHAKCRQRCDGLCAQELALAAFRIIKMAGCALSLAEETMARPEV